MKSPGFRTLTGAVVTLLLVLFVILITTTLVRFPMQEGEQPGSAAPAVSTPAAATPAAEPLAPPAEVDTAAPSPAVSSEGGSAEPEDPQSEPTGGAEFAITFQATPTRRDGAPASSAAQAPEAAASAESGAQAEIGGEAPAPSEQPQAGGLSLPNPDPAAAPAEPLLVFGNANWVSDLAFDGGALWAATSGGALRWGADETSAASFTMRDGLGTNQLTAAVACPIDGFGLVFGSTAGLQVFNPETESWKQITAGGAAIRHNDVSALACDVEQGILVVGYASNGVDVFRARPGRWSYVERSDEVAGQGVDAVAVGGGGAIWIASGGSLSMLQGSRVTTWSADDSALSGEPISALAVGSDDSLWLTAGDRLYHLADNQWESYARSRAQGDFPSGGLVDIQPAQGGRVWLLSESGDICRFDPEFETCVPFYSLEAAEGADETASEGMVRGVALTLAVGENGRVAYGTAGQGSSLLDGSRWNALVQPSGFPAGSRIFALASDANGFLWAATNSGVQQADPARPEESSHLFTAGRDGVVATNVRALFADARGGIWLGGIGASYFDGRRWTHYTQADGLAGDEITAISEDGLGRIWFGTRSGLSIWTGTTFFNLTAENGLPDSEILSLAADGESMWIGSAAGGLYRFESNQLQVLTRENVGLPSDRITALLAAGSGLLLVGTDSGLAAVREGEVILVEGVPEDRITALAAGSDGELWLGTAASGLFHSADGEAWDAVELEDVVLPAYVRALTIDLYGGAWLAGESGSLLRIASAP